ncbi:uncharacterized protein RAG0_13201 [Rhynchosporium agropyri]|uniref:Uncharacterized protein n=1 Tax=Rhynchosporium agropyri TaxID=914238 RepID=A0A1E1LBL0_9HELO|nr:uncharacterized protein RAG0_13201 [Rhynchosporium agropyri]
MGSQDQGCRTGDEDERMLASAAPTSEVLDEVRYSAIVNKTAAGITKLTQVEHTLRPYYLEPGDRERDRIASLDGSTHVHRAPSQFIVLWGCGFPRLPPPSQTDSSQADSAESSIGQANQASSHLRVRIITSKYSTSDFLFFLSFPNSDNATIMESRAHRSALALASRQKLLASYTSHQLSLLIRVRNWAFWKGGIMKIPDEATETKPRPYTRSNGVIRARRSTVPSDILQYLVFQKPAVPETYADWTENLPRTAQNFQKSNLQVDKVPSPIIPTHSNFIKSPNGQGTKLGIHLPAYNHPNPPRYPAQRYQEIKKKKKNINRAHAINPFENHISPYHHSKCKYIPSSNTSVSARILFPPPIPAVTTTHHPANTTDNKRAPRKGAEPPLLHIAQISPHILYPVPTSCGIYLRIFPLS